MVGLELSVIRTTGFRAFLLAQCMLVAYKTLSLVVQHLAARGREWMEAEGIEPSGQASEGPPGRQHLAPICDDGTGRLGSPQQTNSLAPGRIRQPRSEAIRGAATPLLSFCS